MNSNLKPIFIRTYYSHLSLLLIIITIITVICLSWEKVLDILIYELRHRARIA